MMGDWMVGTNSRHSCRIGSREDTHPVSLQQQTRPTKSDDGSVAQDEVDDARKHCSIEASMLGPSGAVICVLFHGHAKAKTPNSSFTRSRTYGSSTAWSEGRWHG
jgi:hypothetical protein